MDTKMSKLPHYRILGYTVTLVMHVGNTIHSHIALSGDTLKDPSVKDMVSQQHSYFTIWNIGFQIIYAAYGLYLDLKLIKGENLQDKTLSKYMGYRRYLFSAIVWPAALFIVCIFWPIFIYDRELIYPAFIDKAMSAYPNYIMHLAILPAVLWEMVYLPRDVPKSHVKNLTAINLLYVVYIGWIIKANATTGLWPYPILHLIEGTILFPLFFVMVYILLHIHYFLQWKVLKYTWGDEQDIKSS